MIEWMSNHAQLLGVAVSAVTAVIWVIYLQLLVSSMRRQRRTNVEITRAGEPGEDAKCLVSNMGAEPVYIKSVIVDVVADGERYTAAATQRREITQDKLTDLAEKTTEGPLESGKSRDVGSFKDLVSRMMDFCEIEQLKDRIENIKILVVMTSGFSKQLAAAEQEFAVTPDGQGGLYVTHSSVTSTQLRGRRVRRQIEERVNRVLREEADMIRRTVGEER
ncbi:MAG: hypothetical protein CML50_25020 [Rhodobacteraceae bacterium]|jgi:hypothetical protein|uniref:Uncharacterized protein n=1 Tax=Salipiger profundus TaxID=1229727 RepID=A0A1U7D9E6_9RHOB|nr:MULTISPECIES: hypothetical protein [Salipiger]APX24690.1 hypothetical protein Ga0080559_TMP3894 [Salipiger profundus]MAB09243.1 hypothetical protein [Paracoccaceae bacterium]GFZ97091.1 hypothetical protein GCM10011326_05510 [Salipiger profundus]SFD01991.1 hypothetical protein SAMN05444415_106303 [Salipiger profundus]